MVASPSKSTDRMALPCALTFSHLSFSASADSFQTLIVLPAVPALTIFFLSGENCAQAMEPMKVFLCAFFTSETILSVAVDQTCMLPTASHATTSSPSAERCTHVMAAGWTVSALETCRRRRRAPSDAGVGRSPSISHTRMTLSHEPVARAVPSGAHATLIT